MKFALLLLAIPLFAADRLENEIERLAKITDGVVGLSAVHLESNRRVALHGTERFPMASSFKVPIAVQLLSRVDRGEVKLDQMVTVEPQDLHPGSGTLSNLFNKPGVSLSVRNLMELMLLISDNSATDMVLRLAGGPEAVTSKMRSLGITGISVNRPTVGLISDWIGATPPPEKEWRPETWSKLYQAVTPEQRKIAVDRFNHDERDTAQPDAMAALLEMIYARKLHKPETADLLLDIMRRCQTGDARIKGMLPPDTTVAHKTGSIGGTVNDVGIVTLPGDAGHVVIALFVKQGSKPEVSERAIAQISRTVYDYFLFTNVN
ncbi:MAG: class A beta-lactamase [Acidobacteriia bacterium]|nr:class A beta-lactamase [Terriglobia bacterium]